MASSEMWHCSICLEVFSDPVSTPCGHNYCRGCILGYWAQSGQRRCPLCQAMFDGKPTLGINREFRDLLEIFKKTSEADPAGVTARPGEVPCDLCEGTKVKAVKSCLVCLASYCPAHLKPHMAAAALQWHQLVEPLESLERRVCMEHNRLREHYCRVDHCAVCAVCAKEEHRAHSMWSVEEELEERRTQLEGVKHQIQRHRRKESAMVERLRDEVRRGRVELQATVEKTLLCFQILTASIEARKVELLDQLEEKQKEAEQQAELVLGELDKNLQQKAAAIVVVDNLLQSHDEFQLLQDLPACPAPSAPQILPLQPRPSLYLEMVRRAVGGVREAFNRVMDDIMRKVGVAETEDVVFDDELGNLQQTFSVRVTLDPRTAHPSLNVSEDRTEVVDMCSRMVVPDNPTRFDSLHYVLAEQGFSGRFYFQVSLGGRRSWELGLVRESISRKGDALSLSPEAGCWTLGCYSGVCQANQSPPVLLALRQVPQKVGVLVDFEGKSVSFYDVELRVLIHSFANCAFTPPQSLAGWSGKVIIGKLMKPTKTKIYPIFRPGTHDGTEDAGPLRIAPSRVKTA